MATKAEIIKELATLNITTEGGTEKILPLTGSETAKQLSDILVAAKAEVEATKNAQPAAVEPTTSKAEVVAPKGSTYVWLKSKAYIDEKQRVLAGLYLVTDVPSRLSKLPKSACEVFENGIAPRKMTEIAKWAGITHPEDYVDNQLLEKIAVVGMKPF